MFNQKTNSTKIFNMEQSNLFTLLIKSMMSLLLVLLSLSSLNAQPTTMWTSRYNGPAMGVDIAQSVATDLAGNVYVTGASDGGATKLDICTIKYGPDGTPSPTWPDMGFGVGVRRYDGHGHDFDQGHIIALDFMGNVIVTGYANDGGTLGIDYVTLKYSPTGILMWVHSYDGGVGTSANTDIPNAMAIDAAGNIYVTGQSGGIGTMYDIATVKYSPAGALMWVSRFNGPSSSDDVGMDIKVDASGNVIVTGYADFGSVEKINFMTIKYSTTGAFLWGHSYNDDTVMNNDYGYALALDASANVYVTGVTVASGNKSYSTVKYTSAGTQAWVKKYDGPGFDDLPVAIAVDVSGNVIVTGKSDEAGTHDFAYATIKYSPAGALLWESRYIGPGVDDEPTAMVLDKFGNIYVTGMSVGAGTAFDYATVKYNPAGVQQWVMRYDNVGMHDVANAIAIDSTGNVIVTGYSSNSPGGPITYDYTTIKYMQPPPPPAPALLSPANNATYQSQTPWLKWTVVPTATSYRVQVSTDSLFGTTVLDSTATIDSIHVPAGRLSNNVKYYWHVNAANSGGTGAYSVKFNFTPGVLGVSSNNEAVKVFKLCDNYPNPFNPNTSIKYQIASNTDVKLVVYDITGKTIATLVDKKQDAGMYEVIFNANNLSSGVYFYKLTTNDPSTGSGHGFTDVKKMMLVK